MSVRAIAVITRGYFSTICPNAASESFTSSLSRIARTLAVRVSPVIIAISPMLSPVAISLSRRSFPSSSSVKAYSRPLTTK